MITGRIFISIAPTIIPIRISAIGFDLMLSNRSGFDDGEMYL
jgi:hypothetical protein